MNAHTARTALFAAIALGLAGDLLLRWIPWGINVPIWTLLFLGVTITLLQRVRPQPLLSLALPSLVALVASAGLAWRDAEMLVALDVLLLLGFLPMLALGPRGIRLAASGLGEIAGALAVTAVQSAGGIFQLVFGDVEWREVSRGGVHRRAGVFVRGFLIALPALILFGVLLSSADAAFAKLLADIFRIDLPEAAAHVAVTLVLTAAVGGFLRSVLASMEMPRLNRPESLRLPAAETNVALALINILFATFVVLQFRYLFGSASQLSYAEYARRGFFELVAVVTLIVPMLLVADWIVAKDNPRALRTFRLLAATQVALVFVIAASAHQRMKLYRDEYGLTEDRFYATAFMVFIATLLVLLVATVLTGHRERFAAGALVLGVIAVFTLHAINPDALILETNIARDRAGKRLLDDRYASSLSDDATPVVMRHLDRFAAQPCYAERLVHRQRPTGWRTWNYSRSRARALMNDERLEAMRRECRRLRVESNAAQRPPRRRR